MSFGLNSVYGPTRTFVMAASVRTRKTQRPSRSTALPTVHAKAFSVSDCHAPTPQPAEKEAEPLVETLRKAGKRALGGGVAGAAAMFCQVGALMWMRTTVNFQYAKGMGTLEALRHLYKEVRLAAAAASSSPRDALPSPRRLPLPL